MKEVFPETSPSCEVVVRKDQKLEILTKFSSSNIEEHEKVLAQLERKISELLKQKLGYEKEFFLTVTME
jgi:hypothetical protein